MTNFKSITESPEKLAEFLDNVTRRCTLGDSACLSCQLVFKCDGAEGLLEWLQEECE